jgi:asparagine synthetase B (glutamine-hydrolysing)
MPGIFGFKIKKGKADIDTSALAEKMAASLIHGSSYRSAVEPIKRGALGVVSVREIENQSLLRNDQNETTTALFGKLFELMDMPADAPNVPRTPLNARTIESLYRLFGPLATKHLNGDFNFCLNDEQSDGLIIGNDRFGFRHLYIYEDNKILMFAPELKAFLQYPEFDRTLDEHGLADYFNYSYQLGNRTFFRHVTMLPPASILRHANGVTELSTYWTAKYEPRLKRKHLDEAIEEGFTRFERSMERRVAGKSHLLVPLSGGLDSRLITATAVKLGCKLTTASFGFPNSTDVRIARKVAKTLKLETPVLVKVRPELILQHGPRVCELGECGYGSLGMTTIHAFAEQLGDQFDGLMNGIFGGHISFGSPYFKRQMVEESMNRDQLLDRISLGLEGQRFSKFLGESVTPEMKELTSAYLKKSVEIEWARTESASASSAFRLDQLFVHNRIRRCMNAIDHNRFFYSDELPFASYELFDLYHSLDPELLLDHFLYKEIYKKKFPALAAIPWQSTGVNLYSTPSSFRKKLKNWNAKVDWYVRRISKGKLNPVTKDKYEDQDTAYRKHRPLKQWVNELILSDRHLARGYFSRQGLLKLIRWEESGGSAFYELAKIAMFELWARRFLDAR